MPLDLSGFDEEATLDPASGMDLSGFDAAQSEEIGFVENAVRQGMSGVTGGYYDEMVGGAHAMVGGDYTTERDKIRDYLKRGSEQHPVSSAGLNLGGFVAGPGKFAKGAKALGAVGGISALGESEADLTEGEVGAAAMDVGKGAALGYGLGKAAPHIGKALSGTRQKVSDLLGKRAGKLAETATGATRAQAEKFKHGTGRQLLDRKVVTAGVTPEKIARRAEIQIKLSNRDIDKTLKGMDAKGVRVNSDRVVQKLNAKIAQLEGNPAFAAESSKLSGIRDDIINVMGKKELPLSTVEQWKRGFRKVNWQDPDAAQARKSAYHALKEVVEETATQANPAAAEVFKAAKKSYAMLHPVEEFAQKRALQLQQHPMLGLNDMTAAIGGSVAGGPVGGIAAAVGRRIVSPRMASTMAKATDVASKAVAPTSVANIMKKIQANPEMAQKYGAQLAQAQKRGAEALASTYYIMYNSTPDFRKAMESE